MNEGPPPSGKLSPVLPLNPKIMKVCVSLQRASRYAEY